MEQTKEAKIRDEYWKLSREAVTAIMAKSGAFRPDLDGPRADGHIAYRLMEKGYTEREVAGVIDRESETAKDRKLDEPGYAVSTAKDGARYLTQQRAMAMVQGQMVQGQ